MGLYVAVRRVAESPNDAEYTYTGDNGETGRIRINKQDGSIELLEQAVGDDRGHYWNRAASKLVHHWVAGSLPEFTSWSS